MLVLVFGVTLVRKPNARTAPFVHDPTSVGRQVHVVTLAQVLPGAVVFDYLAARDPYIAVPALLPQRGPASVVEVREDLVRMFTLVTSLRAGAGGGGGGLPISKSSTRSTVSSRKDPMSSDMSAGQSRAPPKSSSLARFRPFFTGSS